MMKPILVLIISLSLAQTILAQSTDAIKKTVDDFLTAMENKDTVAMDSLMHPQCVLFSTLTAEGAPVIEPIRKVSLIGFMHRAIKKKYIYDEKLWTYDISTDANMATVWTEYTLFIGKENKLSHCGTNVFTLAKNKNGRWVLLSIADTRRKENCIKETTVTDNTTAVNQVLDAWHKASATADADAFFGAMTEDGIYLGTDASERWLRDELREWAKFAFEREVAWAFTSSKRELYFSNNQKTVWFEEMLDTQMGVCRGSGVLTKVDGEWKIRHYDLSIMVPNDLVKDFMTLVEKGWVPKKKKKAAKSDKS